MGFGNLNIFAGGGGGGSGSGIAKYNTAADLPAVATDGDVAIVLDTNNLYSFDTGVGAWVIIGGPGVAITVTDTASINNTLTGNVLSSDLNIGSTTLPANTQGISLLIQPSGSTGLYGYFPAGPITENVSSVLQFFGPGRAVGFSLGIQVNQASGSTPGYLSAADWTRFNNNLGASTQIHTIFPLMGGTFLPSNGGITFQIAPASGTTPGYVTILAQDFSGEKTFNDSVYFGASGANFYDADRSAYVNIAADPTTSAIYAMRWPIAQGATFSWMKNDGMGGMSWSIIGITDMVVAPNSFLGNNTGSTAPTIALTVAQAKALLGISNNNFGDVTLGAFLAATSAVGATITAAQVLAFTEAQTTSPGMMSPNSQTFNGTKFFNAIVTGWSGFALPKPGGPETINLNSPAGLTQSVTYFLPPYHGITNSVLANPGGDGVLSWRPNGTIGGDILLVSAGNGTATPSTRFVGVTTTTADRSVALDFVAGVTGAVVIVQKLDSGLGNVLVGATQGINGASIMILSGQWTKQQFIATGSGFYA